MLWQNKWKNKNKNKGRLYYFLQSIQPDRNMFEKKQEDMAVAVEARKRQQESITRIMTQWSAQLITHLRLLTSLQL